MRSLAVLAFISLLSATVAASNVISNEELFAFVVDAHSYEGQFLSVHDYCTPHVPRFVAEKSLEDWRKANANLLEDRDKAVEDLIRRSQLDEDNAGALRSLLREQVEKARRNDRLYKDLVDQSDKTIPCARRLGEMLSTSMRFERIAKDSYAIWLRYRGN